VQMALGRRKTKRLILSKRGYLPKGVPTKGDCASGTGGPRYLSFHACAR
jgi:hypothetical protein